MFGLKCGGISLYSAMSMVKRNYEFVESTEDGDSKASGLISIEALELSEDLDPSVNLEGEPVMEELVSSLLELSLNSYPSPPVRFLPIVTTEVAVKTLSVVSTGCNGSLLGEREEYTSDSMFEIASSLAAQQQFRSKYLYQSSYYRESDSDKI
ncbi:hypothetical protein AYI68_g7939 [Smittium mucronatum]|uniref:Uncharacterized protein n=1 Tax=Smittium mucronatum TaxID=133383 RepID=A0A1R0GMB3_9FUNG|nr:hypothetical protein AYI68_g7939 [Smittium mucronatum]